MEENQNKRRSEFDKLTDDLTGKHSKKMNAILLTQGDEMGSENDFANNFFKLLEFIKPKLQRAEVRQEESNQDITIEHVVVNNEDTSN